VGEKNFREESNKRRGSNQKGGGTELGGNEGGADRKKSREGKVGDRWGKIEGVSY